MAYALPYSISAEDSAFFSTLMNSALLPETSWPGYGEFAQRIQEEKRARERAFLEPYADLLETEIARQIREMKTEDMLAELRECPIYNMHIKLFSWNTVFFNETLNDMKLRRSAMTYEEQKLHREAVKDRDYEMEQSGACHTLGLMADDYSYSDPEEYDSVYTVLAPVKVNRIFIKTNLAKRLMVLFGPNFVPNFTYETLPGLAKDGTLGYTVTKVTLCARYYPEGLPKVKLLDMLSVFRSEQKRREENLVRTVYAGQWLVGIGNWRMGSRNVSLGQQEPVPLLNRSPCHCGRHWVDDDSE